MKYLTTTFAIACMAFGFASIVATPAQANEEWKCSHNGGQWNIRSNGEGVCDEPNRVYGEINDIDSLEQVAIRDDDRLEDCLITKENPNGMKLCVVADENGNERVAGIEVPDGVELAYTTTMPGCVWNQEKHRYDCPVSSPWLPKAGEAEGEQVAWDTWPDNNQECWETVTKNGPETKCVPSGWGGSPKSEESEGEQIAFDASKCWIKSDGSVDCEDSNLMGLPKAEGVEGERVAYCWIVEDGKCVPAGQVGKYEAVEPVKTASGTFYPLPMVTIAEMDKLLAPGGTSVASFDKILAPGGTAVESDYQFADREDGSGGDFGESGGGDFGEGDRAAASTAAE